MNNIEPDNVLQISLIINSVRVLGHRSVGLHSIINIEANNCISLPQLNLKNNENKYNDGRAVISPSCV